MTKKDFGLLALLFAVATAFYGAVWREAPLEKSDSAGYLRAAADLADGRLDQPRARTMIYPLFLIATGSVPEPGRPLFFASMALRFAEIALLAAVLRAIGAGTAAMLGFTLLMLAPPYMQATGYVMTESMAGFFLAGGLAALYFGLRRRSGWLVAIASLSFGLAAITRPTFQMLAPALAAILVVAALWFGRRTLRATARPALILAVVGSLVVGGYSLYNYVRFGYFGLTYLFGMNLAVRTTTLYEEIDDPVVRRILVDARNQAHLNGDNPYWSALLASETITRLTGETEIELSKRLVKLCGEVIVTNPMAYLQETARSLATFWSPFTSELPLMTSKEATMLWYALQGLFAAAFFVVVALNVGAGALLGRPPAVPFAALAAFAVAVVAIFYNAGISCAFDWGEIRHRTPTDGLAAFAVVVGALLWRVYRAEAALDRRKPLWLIERDPFESHSASQESPQERLVSV